MESTQFWHLDFSLLQVGDYDLSLIETLAASFCLLAFYLLRQNKQLSWPVAILSNFAYFLFFYQINLYGLMGLQVFLVVYNLIVWLRGRGTVAPEIKRLSGMGLILSAIAIFMPTINLTILLAQVHELAPRWFPQPASFNFTDPLLAVSSIVATVLLAKHYLEAWLFWLVIYGLCVVIFAWAGVYLTAGVYMVLLGWAMREYLEWRVMLGAKKGKNSN
ncbi:MAG TPA: nicotinamide riboside transporter PnuC [Haliscomenobacter sp.]|uniref:nicotinamide riboside transporter PnuC n=1 Tax=Haliscomenobacter sp. TaxID=2717303 RepID=UPI002BA01A97|nr:nicotinamide riboside transporter PnuC [Haliscomenobacter sp.]HOY15951.1 nicotinamide riboside transporter PnuC [Haliscomenobacter sp.]